VRHVRRPGHRIDVAVDHPLRLPKVGRDAADRDRPTLGAPSAPSR
jgi:hypothetical protein